MAGKSFGLQKEHWSVDGLPEWASRNRVYFDNLKVANSGVVNGVDRGLGVFAEKDVPQSDGSTVLMQVDNNLILSADKVQEYANSDDNLREILEGLGEKAETPRLAILTFLFVHLTYASTNIPNDEKKPNEWTDYLRFLPRTSTLPTFYDGDEREMIQGTSLESALANKIVNLHEEFTALIACTTKIDWCQRVWWGPTGKAMLADWVYVDAMYRTRALDLPGIGHCMVPCIDMANHAADDETVGLYETDIDDDAVLLLREGKELKKGDEVTITYGDEKGACEMLFSYGFLPASMTDPKIILLDLTMSPDDPLGTMKRACCKVPPGLCLFRDPTTGKPVWESDFVWWMCVNEEDGLAVKVEQLSEEEKNVQVMFKDEVIEPTTILRSMLEKEEMWPVFKLRATVIAENRSRQLIEEITGADANQDKWEEMVTNGQQRKEVYQTLMSYRELEKKFAQEAVDHFYEQKCELAELPIVKDYLQAQQSRLGPGPQEQA